MCCVFVARVESGADGSTIAHPVCSLGLNWKSFKHNGKYVY